MLAAATHVLCIVHVFNAGRSKIQAVAGPKSRCFGPDPALDFSRNGLRTRHKARVLMKERNRGMLTAAAGDSST